MQCAADCSCRAAWISAPSVRMRPRMRTATHGANSASDESAGAGNALLILMGVYDFREINDVTAIRLVGSTCSFIMRNAPSYIGPSIIVQNLKFRPPEHTRFLTQVNGIPKGDSNVLSSIGPECENFFSASERATESFEMFTNSENAAPFRDSF